MMLAILLLPLAAAVAPIAPSQSAAPLGPIPAHDVAPAAACECCAPLKELHQRGSRASQPAKAGF